MKKIDEEIKQYQKYDLDGALKKAYVIALKNTEFKKWLLSHIPNTIFSIAIDFWLNWFRLSF